MPRCSPNHTFSSLFVTIAATVSLTAGGLDVAAAPPSGGKKASAGKKSSSSQASAKPRDPSLRLVVQDFVVPPKPAGAPTPRRFRRRYRRYHRRTKPLYLRATPEGSPLCRVTKGVKVRVLAAKGSHSRVRVVGQAEVEGYVPTENLGFRVLRKTPVLGSASAKDKIGHAHGGVLVSVVRKQGKYTKAMLMGPCPVQVWLKTADLGVADAKTEKMGSYPTGRRMILKKGKIFKSPKGRSVGFATAPTRVYRTKTKGSWYKIALANYRYYVVEVWVPKDRVKYGYYGYWRGNGFKRSSSTYSRGNMVAVVRLSLYMEDDDAYPTAHLRPGARFRVSNLTQRWVQIHYHGPVSFTAYARRAPGLWVPYSSYSGS